MDIIYGIILIIAVGGMLIKIWRNHHENKEMKEELEERIEAERNKPSVSEETHTPQHNTRDLFLSSLSTLGCQYEIDEKNEDKIWFIFQGEQFFAYATNDRIYVDIWDIHWKIVDINDIDAICMLRKAINLSNIDNYVTTFYSIDEENKTMSAHCKVIIPFTSFIPEIEKYLSSNLVEFFRAHKTVEEEMMKQRVGEESRQS